MVEGITFTRDDVVRVASGIGVSHPVIDVLDAHRVKLLEMVEEARVLDPDNRDEYLKARLGFLADEIEDIGGFPATPLDLLAIWTREDCFQTFRYDIAEMISLSYAISDLPDQRWHRFPRFHLEKSAQVEKSLRDLAGLRTIRTRLVQINRATDTLDMVVYGTKKPANHIVRALMRRAAKGDKKADKECETFLDIVRTKRIPVVHSLGEAFENGVGALLQNIGNALE